MRGVGLRDVCRMEEGGGGIVGGMAEGAGTRVWEKNLMGGGQVEVRAGR